MMGRMCIVGFIRFEVLGEIGYVVFDDYIMLIDFVEWCDFEYVGWCLFGIICFVLFISYVGDVDCNGFWNYILFCIDKDGVWVVL